MSDSVTVTVSIPRELAVFIHGKTLEALKHKQSTEDRDRLWDFEKKLYRAINISQARFVYIFSTSDKKGYISQLWPLGQITRDHKAIPTLQSHLLTTKEAALSIQELEVLYPYVKPEEKV